MWNRYAQLNARASRGVERADQLLLITGASGFVGPRLISSLATTGFRGVAVSRRLFPFSIPGWRLCQRNSVLQREGSQGNSNSFCLIHLEVKQHVQNPTQEDLAEFGTVNVQGTAQWLDFCARNAIKKFVFFSTIKAVQVDRCRGCNEGIDENVSGPGDTPYGESKWKAEELVRRWCSEDAQRSGLILRPSVVYGPGNAANVFAMVKALDAWRFFCVGQNENIKSLVSLNNLCAAVVHLLPRMKPGVEVYNIVDRESYSVRRLAKMISSALGCFQQPRTIPLPVAKIAAQVGDAVTRITGKDFPLTSNRLNALIESTHFSCEKLIGTDFVHPQTTQEGIEEMVEWYKGVARKC